MDIQVRKSSSKKQDIKKNKKIRYLGVRKKLINKYVTEIKVCLLILMLLQQN